jgi:hypothetical protein
MRRARLRNAICVVTAGSAIAAAGASPASGAVTLGQTAASTPAANCSNIPDDWVQTAQSSGNSYTVPGKGTITSWSTWAAAVAGQDWSLRIYRHVTGVQYRLVAKEGPHELVAGALNTFAAAIPVEPGDRIGMNQNDGSAASAACTIPAPAGNEISFDVGNLAIGSVGTFGGAVDERHLNISALFEPSNVFTLGTPTRNRKKGVAVVPVTLPNPGRIAVTGKGVKVVGGTKKPLPTGTTALRVKAKGKQKRKLRTTGKVKLLATFSYTPTGGAQSTQALKLKLKRKLTKKRR